MRREGRDPFNTLSIPPNRLLLEKALTTLARESLKTDTLGRLVAKDPVMMLELCKTVSSTAYARADVINILPPGQMITVLGVAAMNELLQGLDRRPPPDSPELEDCLENGRARCLKISGIARIIGGSIDVQLAEQCALLGLFAHFGDLLAVLYLGDAFLSAANEEPNRVKLAYRLAKEHAFDLEKAGVRYLNMHGLPEKVVACIDRDSQISSTDLINRKLVVLSSMEVWSAYEESRWDRYEPDKALPVRSHLRPLKFLGINYERLYQDLSEYLARQIDNVAEAESPAVVQESEKREASDPGAGVPSSDSRRRVTLSEASSSAQSSRMGLSFLGKPSPSVVACIRGIRNAENLFSGAQSQVLKDTMIRLISPIFKSRWGIAEALKRAGESYHPLTLLDADGDDAAAVVEVLSPGEISCVVALTHIATEISRYCEGVEWEWILGEARIDIEAGRLVGCLYGSVGAGTGMLIAGVRRLSLGVFLYHDSSGLKEYRKHLVRSRRTFDSGYEQLIWKKDHLSFCGPLLQSLGFGTDLSRVFEECGDPFEVTDKQIRFQAFCLKWVEIIREHGHILGDPDFVRRVGISRDEVLMLDAEVKRLLGREKWAEWLQAEYLTEEF